MATPILKKLGRTVRRLFQYARRFGPFAGAAILFKVLLKHPVAEFHLPGLRSPVFMRTRTADLDTFEMVFIDREYDHPAPPAIELIIDAGAHVGYSAIFFARRYPLARILAVEPEASNFEMLVRNTRTMGNVTPIRAALWNRETPLRIVNPDAPPDAFQVKEAARAGAADFEVVTLPGLLRRAGRERIDILKLDIEGAEKDLFESGSEEWLDKVGMLIIETHDRLRPGCMESIERALGGRKFTRTQRGDVLVLVREG